MKKHATQLFVFISGFLFVSTVHAQLINLTVPGFGIETNTLTGRIIRHSANFKSPIPDLSVAMDINFVWQTYGKKDWQQRRNFPTIGAGITFTDYGNNRVYGRCVGIYTNITIPIIKRRNWEWTVRLGDGMGYVTRRNRYPVDSANCAISTHINDFAIFMTDVRWHIDDHWQVQMGANFTHISNGDYYQPNLGVNMAGLHVGVQYYPVTNWPKAIVRELPKLKNRWLAEMRVSTYYKEARAQGNPVVPSYLVAGYASRRWLGKNKMFIGADYMWHEDVYRFLLATKIHEGPNQRNWAWDGAVFAGNEFLVGRLGLITQVGVYYHQTYLKFDDVYEKIGAHFYLLRREKGPVKELFISGMLLTHEITAQFAEFGLGVGI
jgi:Lipid A 3-O-deacylase (PagL)